MAVTDPQTTQGALPKAGALITITGDGFGRVDSTGLCCDGRHGNALQHKSWGDDSHFSKALRALNTRCCGGRGRWWWAVASLG